MQCPVRYRFVSTRHEGGGTALLAVAHEGPGEAWSSDAERGCSSRPFETPVAWHVSIVVLVMFVVRSTRGEAARKRPQAPC